MGIIKILSEVDSNEVTCTLPVLSPYPSHTNAKEEVNYWPMNTDLSSQQDILSES
tara:strand:+ start:681 stop:845 length:165 start_codon:yes stop_codon:yes gene_type:complete